MIYSFYCLSTLLYFADDHISLKKIENIAYYCAFPRIDIIKILKGRHLGKNSTHY